MSERHVRKMLRQMASGQPVRVDSAMAASVKELAQLAFIAEQFGYEYADIRHEGGPQGKWLAMVIVPALDPQSRARAAQNWAWYPNAGDGVSLPPLVPEEVELLKARIKFDLLARRTPNQLVWLICAGGAVASVRIGFQLRAHTTLDPLIVGIMWAALMAFIPYALVINRRHLAKHAALLQAAGFTPVTEPDGWLRYVPPGRQLPGHSDPFAKS